MQFAVIAPFSTIARRSRLTKMMPVLKAKGLAPIFYGWERVVGEAQGSEDKVVEERIILRGGGNNTRRARLMYPLWMVAVFWLTLRLGRRANLFCLGWETAFPALIASRFTGARVIFDDADRFSLIISLPRPLHRLVQALERWTSRRVDLHIVPSFARYEWRGQNMMVLRNVPVRSDYERARGKKAQTSTAGLVVYVNGWFGETRGGPIFIEMMKKAADRNLPIRMILAGRLAGPACEKLAAQPNVEYRGKLELVEALKLYREADLVLTYFDPAIPINRLAESNKWGDCVFLDVPFIVNSEVETAASFVRAGGAMTVPYHDVDGLLELLAPLAEQPARLAPYRNALRHLEEEYQPFDTAFGVLIDSFLAGETGLGQVSTESGISG